MVTMQTPCSLSLAIAAAAAAVLAPLEARAEDGAVIVSGASRPERAVIARAVEGAARAALWSLGDPLEARDVEVISSCLAVDRPWPCIAPIAKARGLQRIVVVHAEPERADGGELVLTGQLVVAGNGVPAIDRRYCARCGDAELAAAAVELMRRLLEDSASRAGRTRLDVRTSPPGALVSIDGQVVGESDRVFATNRGRHELRLQRSGCRAEVREVTVNEGEVEIVSVGLECESGGEGDSRGAQFVPWIAVGGGAIAVVGGMYASFTATSDPTGPQHKYNYSAAGIEVAIIGTVVAGAGVYLWLRSSRIRSGPTLSVRANGYMAGWITRL
jgi:hypothetical protein